MDIPQGYKQTELGIIPEDLEVVVIGEQGILQNRSVNPQQEPHKIFCEYSMPSYDNDKISPYTGVEMRCIALDLRYVAPCCYLIS